MGVSVGVLVWVGVRLGVGVLVLVGDGVLLGVNVAVLVALGVIVAVRIDPERAAKLQPTSHPANTNKLAKAIVCLLWSDVKK